MSETTTPIDATPSTANNIFSILDAIAEKQPNDLAFIVPDDRESSPTFSQLRDRVGRCAAGLRSEGIQPGDKIICFVPMSLELYILMLAVFRMGAVAVFIDPWGGRNMIEQAAELVDAKMFIGIPKAHALRAMSKTIRAVPKSIIVAGESAPALQRFASRGMQRYTDATTFEELMRAGAAADPIPVEPVMPDTPALITFTGGTTGIPKGANRTHQFLLAQHTVLGNQTSQVPGDIHYTNLPIVVLHSLGIGVTTLLAPRDQAQNPHPDGTALHGLLAKNNVTVVAFSPGMLDALATSKDRTALTEIKTVFTGGGPVLCDLLERIEPFVPNAEVTVMYGSTESEPIAHCSSADAMLRRRGVHEHGGIFVGWPVSDVQIMIIRETDKPITIAEGGLLGDWLVEPGSPGEVIVTGPHVNRDYFHNKQAFIENKIVDEHGTVWHRTGDIARTGADDGLWLLGRRGGSFRLNGHTVYALEVETPLADLPQIARAAVVTVRFDGSSREFKNAAAVLAIEPSDGYSRQDARDAAIRCLRSFGFDRSLEVRTMRSIPLDKRHATKIDLDALRKKLKPAVPPDSY